MSLADKLTTIAENQPKVYKAGIEKMWDCALGNGERENFYYGFRGWSLSNDLLKVRRDVTPVGDARYMFYKVKNIGTEPINLKTIEEQSGIKFDFSKVTTFASMFVDAEIEVLNVVDLSSANENGSALYNMFSSGTLKRIEKLIVSEDTEKFYSSFYSAKSLTHCIFEGVINKSGLAIYNYVKLDKESVTSIINVLSDETSGLSVSIHGSVIDKAFETSEGANDGRNSDEWLSLIATKPNWTISL